MSTDVVSAPEVQPVAAGTFAIYEDGQGGYVLVTQMPSAVTEENPEGVARKHIPGALVKMATGGGLLGRRLGSLFGD